MVQIRQGKQLYIGQGQLRWGCKILQWEGLVHHLVCGSRCGQSQLFRPSAAAIYIVSSSESINSNLVMLVVPNYSSMLTLTATYTAIAASICCCPALEQPLPLHKRTASQRDDGHYYIAFICSEQKIDANREIMCASYLWVERKNRIVHQKQNVKHKMVAYHDMYMV